MLKTTSINTSCLQQKGSTIAFDGGCVPVSLSIKRGTQGHPTQPEQKTGTLREAAIAVLKKHNQVNHYPSSVSSFDSHEEERGKSPELSTNTAVEIHHCSCCDEIVTSIDPLYEFDWIHATSPLGSEWLCPSCYNPEGGCDEQD